MAKAKKTDEEIIDEVESVIEEKESEVDNEIEVLHAKIGDLENQYRRAIADYQNLEKRTFEEKREWIRGGNKDLLLKILPVLDILFLAAKHINDKGLDLSIQQFLDVLVSEGVVRIETVGKAFNPHTMECVEVVAGEENIVLEEVRAGYLLHERVLRSAQVKVGGK